MALCLKLPPEFINETVEPMCSIDVMIKAAVVGEVVGLAVTAVAVGDIHIEQVQLVVVLVQARAGRQLLEALGLRVLEMSPASPPELRDAAGGHEDAF